jgi:putative hydrolases of HD superfamily
MLTNEISFLKKLSFITEIDKLKTIDRRSLLRDGSRNENSAEHSWHLALMVILLVEYAPPQTNLLSAIKMALIHDIVEIDAGDTFCFDPTANLDRMERELAAASRIFNILPDNESKRFLGLWEEFESGKTSTAKFVIAVDRFQPFLQSYFPNRYPVIIDGIHRKQFIERMLPIKEGMPGLWSFVESEIEKYFFSLENFELGIRVGSE